VSRVFIIFIRNINVCIGNNMINKKTNVGLKKKITWNHFIVSIHRYLIILLCYLGNNTWPIIFLRKLCLYTTIITLDSPIYYHSNIYLLDFNQTINIIKFVTELLWNIIHLSSKKYDYKYVHDIRYLLKTLIICSTFKVFWLQNLS